MASFSGWFYVVLFKNLGHLQRFQSAAPNFSNILPYKQNFRRSAILTKQPYIEQNISLEYSSSVVSLLRPLTAAYRDNF